MTGRRCGIGDDELIEVVMPNGTLGWLPVHPDVVYGRTGEWTNWDDFLGIAKGKARITGTGRDWPVAADRPSGLPPTALGATTDKKEELA
jgi:hypothetical protein